MQALVLKYLFILNFLPGLQSSHRECIDTLPGVLIIDAFDPESSGMRKNKRELFRDLSDNLKSYVSMQIRKNTRNQPVIILQTMKGCPDSSVYGLMKDKNISISIVIRSFDMYFQEGTERDELSSDGKPMIVTPYQLCSKIQYYIYGRASLLTIADVIYCEPFTERTQERKGFNLKFGPDIVKKKKYTFGVAESNAAKFIRDYRSYFAR